MASELKDLMAGELSQRYGEGTDYLVVGYTRLTGSETTDLRRRLRAQNVRMEVVKNSIARRALEASGLGGGVPFLDGPSALVTGEAELPELCRVMADCTKQLPEKLVLRGGVMGELVLDAGAALRLARIPPLPVLHAQIAGCFQTPIANVAAMFLSLHRSLVCALEGIRKQKEEGAGPPEADASPHASDPQPA